MDYVFNQLAAGATAVTSTRRLSRYLLERFAAFQMNRGEAVWSTPVVFTWSDWLFDEWEQQAIIHPLLGMKVVLDDQQEAQLWESIIRSSLHRHPQAPLLQVSATARVVKETWRLLHDWQIPLDLLANTYIEDTQACFDWACEFAQHLDSHDWVCACQIGSRLQKQAEDGSWLPGGKVLLIGFDEWLPSQRSLIHALEQAGADVETIAPPSVNQLGEVQPCSDRQNEFEAAAEWSRTLLATGERGPIGVIVNDLQRCRNDVEIIFDQVLHPKESLGYGGERRRAFHISLGRPLNEHSMVAAALVLLKLMLGSRPIEEISSLLHTPFMAGGLSELSLRADVDLRLRQRGWEKVSLRGLIRFVEGMRVPAMHLLKCLRRATNVETTGARSPAQWSQAFVEWLSLLGWPGERAPNSTEYQTVQAWRDMLARFARLTIVVPELSCEQAINRLENLTRQKIFQVRSVPAPVQIMGVLEASGMEFSHLWISGASDDAWPPPPQANPFLPYDIQRRYRLPGTVPELELARATRIASRLVGSARSVVASYPRQCDDQTLQLSPVFQGLPVSGRRYVPFNLATDMQRVGAVLDECDDVYGIALDDSPLSGGVSIFRDQSACPFRAFARHRLQALGRPEIEPGLTPAHRGILVHACIAEFWGEIRTATALKALSNDELDSTLSRIIAGVITKLYEHDRSSFRQAILDIERIRLLALLKEWLRTERVRDRFEVREIEQKVEARFSGMNISLRIDRIDELANGQSVLIDYKTGREIRVEHWLGDRPEDPQLPLYILCVSADCSALAFAHLRKGGSGFKGVSRFKGFAKGVEQYRDWDALQHKWQQVLGGLADQFKAGYARVDPKDSKVCQQCDVLPFCRIFEVKRKH